MEPSPPQLHHEPQGVRGLAADDRQQDDVVDPADGFPAAVHERAPLQPGT